MFEDFEKETEHTESPFVGIDIGSCAIYQAATELHAVGIMFATGVVLPVITNQKMNAYLKEIADLAKIKKNLTTHVARHTFASMSLCNNESIEVISKMLGHSDIKTTQIYAKMQDQAVYDCMATMRSKFGDLHIV